MQTLEFQYSPSRWSKRYSDPDQVIENHVVTASKASELVKCQVPNECEIRYGSGENQLVDLFGTDLPADASLLVYIHGGYWQALDRKISSYPVIPLYKKGIKVLVAGYDLAPTVTMEEIVQEMKDLWAFIKNTSKSQKIWFMGHSAGAYLAVSALEAAVKDPVTSNFVKGAILISGVFDLVPLVETYVNDALKLSRDTAINLSYNKVVQRNNGPCFKLLFVVGENDPDEFHRQSKDIQRVSENSRFHVIKDVDHFEIVEKLADYNYSLTEMVLELILEK